MRLQKSIYATVITATLISTSFAVASAAEKETGHMSHKDGHMAHWGYDGDSGPDHWSELDDKFSLCGTGLNQSPIDLTNMTQANMPAIHPTYTRGGTKIINNGHTIQVNYEAGNYIDIDNKRFELKQFHFHAPSENTMDGKHFPLEAHLVHASADGSLAVVALMFSEGKFNPELEKAWVEMPTKTDKEVTLKKPVDVSKLLPGNLDYYRFNGSLTTPPCSEGVRWLVIKEPVYASKAQIKKFSSVMKHPNNRPVQPLNARQVLK